MFDLSYAPSALDNRSELGYGTNKPKFHDQRSKGDFFPYVDPASEFDEYYGNDSYEEDDYDDDSLFSIYIKNMDSYSPVDYMSNRSANRFYVSSIKLADCFYRTDNVITEMLKLEEDILIENQSAAVHAANSGYPGGSLKHPTGSRHFRLPGSKQGYFSPPPKKYEDPENDPFDENIFDLEDLAKKIKNVRGK